MADIDRILEETWKIDELAAGWKMAGLAGEPWRPPTPEEEALGPAISPNPADTIAAIDDYFSKLAAESPQEFAETVSGFAAGTGPAGPGMVGMLRQPGMFTGLLSKIFGKKATAPAGEVAPTPTTTKTTHSETPPSAGTGKEEIVAPEGSQGTKTATPVEAVPGKKPAQPKGAQLGAGVPIEGGLIEHPITLEGKRVGELRINPVTSRIEWLGNLETLEPLKLGKEGLKALGDNLASLYPNLGVVTATKIKGGKGPFVAGIRDMVIDLNAIRRTRANTPDPVADAIKEVVNTAVGTERIRQGDKRIQPNAVSQALGRELGLTEQQVLANPEFENMAPLFYARVDLANKAFTNAKTAYAAGDDEALKQFTQQAIGLQANAENYIGEAARVTQAGRDEVFQWMKTTGDALRQEMELHQSMYPNIPLSGAQIRKMIDAVGFDTAMKDVQSGHGYFWNMWVSYWMSNAFSNITRTSGINIENAYVNTIKQAAVRELGALSQKVVRAKPLSPAARKAGEREALVQGEGLVQLGWNLQGFKTVMKDIAQSWRGGGVRGMYRDFITAPRLEHTSKLEAVPTGPAISSENVIKGILYHRGQTLDQLDPNGLLRPFLDHLDATSKAGKAINIVGELIHTPLQALEQGDRASYQMLIYGSRAAAAHARGVLEGLEGDALVRFISKEVQNPSTLIEQEAKRLSLHELYRDAIQPGFAQSAMARAAQYPLLRMVQLVYKTPFNIERAAVEDVPGLQMILKSVREDYKAGGARASMARGRMMFGSMALSLFGWLAYTNRLDGSGPVDPRARALWEAGGHKPHTLAIWTDSKDPSNVLRMPTAALGPLGIQMSAMADMVQMSRWQSATPSAIDDSWWEKAERYVYWPMLMLAKDATNQLFMQGFIRLIDAIEPNPGETEEKWFQRATRYAEQIGSLMIPAHSLLKDMNVEVNTWMDDLRATVPFWSSSLKSKLDDYGDEDYSNMLNTMTGVFPVWKSTEMQRVNEEVQKNAPHLRTVPRFLDGEELSGNDEHDFKRVRGRYVQYDGQTFKEAMKSLIDSPAYREETPGRDGGRSAMLSSMYNYFTDSALTVMSERDAKFLNLKSRIEKESRKAGHPYQHPFTGKDIGISLAP